MQHLKIILDGADINLVKIFGYIVAGLLIVGMVMYWYVSMGMTRVVLYNGRKIYQYHSDVQAIKKTTNISIYKD